MERMSTKVQARSPEMNELTCVPETQQSQQAAGMEEVVVGGEDPRRCPIQNRVTLHLRHSRNQIQVLRTLLTYRTHVPLGGHRRASAKARASQPQGRGNLYQEDKAYKEARKLLFCSLLRVSRN